MNLLKIENSLKSRIRKIESMDKKNRQLSLIILTNNCLAGFLYHDYKMRFNSPTINLQIMPDEFIKFCKNLDYYTAQKLVEVKEVPSIYYNLRKDHDFPVGKLGDITIFFQHYYSFAEAKAAWEKRTKRMEDLLHKGTVPYVILVQKNVSIECINQFNTIKFKNKIVLSTIEDKNKGVYRLPEWSNRDWWEYKNWHSLKRNYESFNFKEWLNLS